MSKKRDFHLHYSIMVNNEEYHREFTVRRVRNKEEAETKLRSLCKVDIVITSNEPL